MHETSSSIEPFIDSYLRSFDRYSQTNFIGFRPSPSMTEIETVVEEVLELLFPGRGGRPMNDETTVRSIICESMEKVSRRLERQMFLAWYHEDSLGLPDSEQEPYLKLAKETVMRLLDALPSLRAMMKEDARAALEGDPAAKSVREILICYPGLRALTIHRIAHFLHGEHVPLVPRMLSETVHKQTGIDIHPGAKIGRCLFIDHGTGVVIGETSVIGNQVKIYQGVTLGALSFPKDACGALIRGTKRHPTLEDNVTVYANATLLGDIVIGHNTTIGSNVWIKESIPANTLVQMEDPKIVLRQIKQKPQPAQCPPLNP